MSCNTRLWNNTYSVLHDWNQTVIYMGSLGCWCGFFPMWPQTIDWILLAWQMYGRAPSMLSHFLSCTTHWQMSKSTHTQSVKAEQYKCLLEKLSSHTHLKGRLLSDLHQGIHQLLDSFWCDVVFLTMGAMFSLLVIRTIHEASQTFPPSTHLAAGKNVVGRPHFRIQLAHSS